mgnify:CR=1 FL=1
MFVLTPECSSQSPSYCGDIRMKINVVEFASCLHNMRLTIRQDPRGLCACTTPDLDVHHKIHAADNCAEKLMVVPQTYCNAHIVWKIL